jgi:rSAM/selenodomain-associated transferase 1
VTSADPVAAHRTLGVFVKQPRPAAVKTRLAPALGADAAAELYRALVEHVLEATTPEGSEYERLVFYDPPDAAEAMRAWLPAGRLRRQSAGDLGARLADAFARTFARGAQRVAIVGSDVPGLTRGVVVAAFDALEQADVVLGPAHDGGYYLVALREPRPELFRHVSWSTPSVLQQTLALATSAGLRVVQLAPQRDLDTLDDLRAEWPALQSLLSSRPELRACVARAIEVPVTK